MEIKAEDHIGLVWSIIKKYIGRGLENDDLFQIGCIGLTKAINKFDESKGYKFATYATCLIHGELKREFRDNGSQAKISRSLYMNGSKVSSLKYKYSVDSVSELDEELIFDEIKMTKAEAEKYESDLYKARYAISLDEDVSSNESDSKSKKRDLYELISDYRDVSEDVCKQILVENSLKMLQNNEKDVIKLRFYYDMTQTQIAKTLGISQVQVSRIETRAKKKMKNYIDDYIQ